MVWLQTHFMFPSFSASLEFYTCCNDAELFYRVQFVVAKWMNSGLESSFLLKRHLFQSVLSSLSTRRSAVNRSKYENCWKIEVDAMYIQFHSLKGRKAVKYHRNGLTSFSEQVTNRNTCTCSDQIIWRHLMLCFWASGAITRRLNVLSP